MARCGFHALKLLPRCPLVLFALVLALGASRAATPPAHSAYVSPVLEACLPAAHGLQKWFQGLMLKHRRAADAGTGAEAGSKLGAEDGAEAGGGLPDFEELGDEYATLVLVRHGMSIWNKDNRFTAWMDVPLSRHGLEDALRAGRLCKAAGIKFDVAFTSVLQRAVKTCNMILEEVGRLWIPVVCDWRLNERHDGVLTGLNKKMAVVQFGETNVTTWCVYRVMRMFSFVLCASYRAIA